MAPTSFTVATPIGFDIDTSFGKKTAYIDLLADADRTRALDFVRDCDVFVQGFRWGSLAKRGFGPQELWRINPRLVYVEVNAYGFQGPWAERRGWEQLAQAATGLAAMHSAELGEPALIPAYFNDYGSGCLGALGVLSALLRRAEEGGRWIVRASLARTAMLGMRFAANAEAPVPISQDDLNHYLVDQDSPLGLLTRVAPAIYLEKSPPYVDRAGSFPGSSTLDIGWGPDLSRHTRRRTGQHRSFCAASRICADGKFYDRRKAALIRAAPVVAGVIARVITSAAIIPATAIVLRAPCWSA